MLTERIYYANQPSKIMVLKVKDGENIGNRIEMVYNNSGFGILGIL